MLEEFKMSESYEKDRLNNERQACFNDTTRVGMRVQKTLIKNALSDKKIILIRDKYREIDELLTKEGF
jgi:hypothetical protein